MTDDDEPDLPDPTEDDLRRQRRLNVSDRAQSRWIARRVRKARGEVLDDGRRLRFLRERQRVVESFVFRPETTWIEAFESLFR